MMAGGLQEFRSPVLQWNPQRLALQVFSNAVGQEFLSDLRPVVRASSGHQNEDLAISLSAEPMSRLKFHSATLRSLRAREDDEMRGPIEPAEEFRLQVGASWQARK